MSGDTFTTINPYNGQIISTYKYMSFAESTSLIEGLQRQMPTWQARSVSERASLMRSLSLSLQNNKMDIAKLMSFEMGKPWKQSLAEIDKCIGLIEYMCDHAMSILEPQVRTGFTLYYQPLGVIYGIMPWNFPVWQTLRFAIPALLAGNTILLKPADNVTGTGRLLQKCFDDVDALKGVFATVSISHETSDRVIAHKAIRGVSLTGSSRAGSQVAKVAGEHLKKCVLELGGNDAYIICEDADVDWAVERFFQGRILNTGQSCISAKRCFVHASLKEIFCLKLIEKIKSLQIGGPLDEGVDMGPLARKDLKALLQKQVDSALEDGAQILFQQDLKSFQGQGAYFPATVLHNISGESCVHSEELFGPVFLIISFQTVDEAIRIANQSPYGLGGAVFCKNKEEARNIALKIETGSLAINDFLRSTFDRPFGGIKDSGYGRELGKEGFFEFVNVKAIVDSSQSP